MSSSANEDREQSKNASMEKSDLMTIEFLRARLLAERSVSKTARQRADELANRVVELEEQLKYVYLQREKAEKATSDILVILKNHGMSDVSEEFDSSSDQEEDSQDFKARKGPLSMEETSTNVRNREKEVYSSSEIESSPSTGRSLSWKSTRESQRSFEKKKFIDPIRRRASFSSSSSSSRRVGKSCRRIKRKETRSVEELPNEGNESTTYSKGSSNYSDGETVVSTERSVLGRSNGTQKGNNRYFEKDEDMESALHQAELIGRYEEEEKAQREWEEKFRENNSCTQDSCDPGNHSDVTEERYETKSTQQSYDREKDQEKKQDPADLRASEEPETSELSPSLADTEKGSLAAPDSSPPDSSFLKSLKSLEDSGSSNEPSKHTPANTSPSCDSKITPLSSRSDLAVVPQETSNNLGSVLEALHRAKSSLSEKLRGSPRAAGGTSGRVAGPSNTKTDKLDSFQIPFGTPGLFRLPTDFQFEAAQPSFANLSNELAAADRFLTEPRSALSTALTQEMRPHSQPYSSPVHDSYPFLPDITLHIPLNEEALSRNFPSAEKGLPPVMRLSSYDAHSAPNMYR